MKIILCATLLLAALTAPWLHQNDIPDRARRLHRDALVFDAHVHFINRQFYLGGSIGERYNDGQVDLPRLREGGVIGFHIGNEFHNRKMFEWLTARRVQPFWDTSAVAKRVAGKSIEEIDHLVKTHYPGSRSDAPDELLMSVDEWVDVVDRAIQLAGEDHVALGSDFDGGPTPPRGMRDVRDLAMVTDAMLRRGYSEQRIRKFLGGNLLRVFRQVTEKKQGR